MHYDLKEVYFHLHFPIENSIYMSNLIFVMIIFLICTTFFFIFLNIYFLCFYESFLHNILILETIVLFFMKIFIISLISLSRNLMIV